MYTGLRLPVGRPTYTLSSDRWPDTPWSKTVRTGEISKKQLMKGLPNDCLTEVICTCGMRFRIILDTNLVECPFCNIKVSLRDLKKEITE